MSAFERSRSPATRRSSKIIIESSANGQTKISRQTIRLLDSYIAWSRFSGKESLKSTRMSASSRKDWCQLTSTQESPRTVTWRGRSGLLQPIRRISADCFPTHPSTPTAYTWSGSCTVESSSKWLSTILFRATSWASHCSHSPQPDTKFGRSYSRNAGQRLKNPMFRSYVLYSLNQKEQKAKS